MLQDLSVSEAQQIAEAIVQRLIEDAASLDPAALVEVLQSGLQNAFVQDLIAALVSIHTEELPAWISSTLEEPDWDPEY